MVLPELTAYLSSHDVPFTCLSHARTITAQETAAAAHIPGRELAKTVMVNVDGRMQMVVLPAPERLDTDKLRGQIGAKAVSLADEREFEKLFPGCEAGAMPPFGNLYGMKVYVAKALTEDDQIAFNAGSHTDLVQMAFDDYSKLVRPEVLDISCPN